MPLSVTPVSPELFPVQASRVAEKVVPPEFPSVALQKEGVRLLVMILRITTLSIVLLVGYIFAMELIVARDIRSAYEHAQVTDRSSPDVRALLHLGRSPLDRLAEDLAAIRHDPGLSWTPESLENAKLVLKAVAAPGTGAADHALVLGRCVPPPADSARDTELDRCIEAVAELKRMVSDGRTTGFAAPLASEAVDRLLAHRQSVRQFWTQAAQLILVNVLLPLLTALLGYIFGTHHSTSG